MSDTRMVYWKTKPDHPDARYVSGYCPEGAVPCYGEVGKRPLPADIYREEGADGSFWIKSPLLICSRYAYQLRYFFHPEFRDDVAEASLDALLSRITTHRFNAPEPDTDVENWWWYMSEAASDSWAGNARDAPTRLLRKWLRPFLDTLTSDCPNHDAVLAEWDKRLAAYAASVSRSRAARPSWTRVRKMAGDLVVAPEPITFASGRVAQLFVLRPNPGDRRKRLVSIMSTGARAKVPHGPMGVVSPETLAEMPLSPPVRLVALHIGWARADGETGHSRLEAAHRWYPDFRAAREAFDTWMEDVTRLASEIASRRTAVQTSDPSLDELLRKRKDMRTRLQSAINGMLFVRVTDATDPATRARHEEIRSLLADASRLLEEEKA